MDRGGGDGGSGGGARGEGLVAALHTNPPGGGEGGGGSGSGAVGAGAGQQAPSLRVVNGTNAVYGAVQAGRDGPLTALGCAQRVLRAQWRLWARRYPPVDVVPVRKGGTVDIVPRVAVLLRWEGLVEDVPAALPAEPADHLLVEARGALAAEEADGGVGGGTGPVPGGVAEPLLEEGGVGGRGVV